MNKTFKHIEYKNNCHFVLKKMQKLLTFFSANNIGTFNFMSTRRLQGLINDIVKLMML